MKPAYELLEKPKLLIVDGGGTLFDPRSITPVHAFQKSFECSTMENGKPYGIEVQSSTTKKGMGMSKLQHLKILLEEQEVSDQFDKKFSRKPKEEDAQRLYAGFKEQLYPLAAKTEEIEGVKDAAYRLKEAGIPLIMTTGYDKKMVDEIRKVLPWLGDVLLASFTSDDVKEGRPAPYLIHHAMEAAGVENAAYVVKVGDTEVDVEAADNAYAPGILVLTGSIETQEEAEKVNKKLGREHLILPSLEDVINFILD